MQSTPSQPVLRVALPVPLRQLFDYLPAEDQTCPVTGQRVLVPFGHRKMIGVIVAAFLLVIDLVLLGIALRRFNRASLILGNQS